MKKTVIVFGNDHTNSVGVIQSLGKLGYTSIELMFGHKSDLVRSSEFSTRIIAGKSPQSCIDTLLSDIPQSIHKIPIIACCDIAALTLKRNADRLKQHFVFEHSTHYTLSFLAKKENQVILAQEAGLRNLQNIRKFLRAFVIPV